MSQFMQPPIVLLREGTDTSQGKGQVISNINACQAVAETIRTTLGPRGMDKMIHSSQGSATISNDGATIMKLLDVVHPAAKTLVEIAKSQDAEVGDGTTTVVLLAAEFMRQSKAFVEEGMHPQVIIRGYRRACQLALDKLQELAVHVDNQDPNAKRIMLERCAATALNSKLICTQKNFFAPMVVDAVSHLDEERDLDMIGIKKVAGGSITDSQLVRGVAFKKTFSYAGFEQQPKYFENPRIVCLNVELELKSEKENAEVRITDPDQYQSIVDAEWNIIYRKLQNIVDSGAQVVLSRLAIGDLATQYFADRNIFCAGRVPQTDLARVSKATAAVVQTSVNDLNDDVIGTCALFEEKQVGEERFNFFTGCPNARTCSIIIRGGAEQFIAEAERSLHDAIMIVKRTMGSTSVVGGGGAVEMELSRHLRSVAKTIKDKNQIIISAFAKALETIPRQLADNAGFDATDIVNTLRAQHANGNVWSGVDIENEGVCDTMQSFVWEPTMSKMNSISSATEACCLILSVDETVKNPQSQAPGQ